MPTPTDPMESDRISQAVCCPRVNFCVHLDSKPDSMDEIDRKPNSELTEQEKAKIERIYSTYFG